MICMIMFRRNSEIDSIQEIVMSNGALEVTVIPDANMVISSFKKNGEEILGQRFGLDGYVNRGKSFGIPLLYPWANRVTENTYIVDDFKVSFSTEGMKVDENGYANHGLMTAIKGWNIETFTIGSELILEGKYSFNEETPNFDAYPFVHEVVVTYTLSEDELDIKTKVVNTSGRKIPIAFGWHPHFNADIKNVHVFGEEYNIPLNAKVLPVEVFNSEDTDASALMFKMEDGWGAIMDTVAGPMQMATQSYGYMLQWDPEGDSFIAVEPMTANIDPFKNDCITIGPDELYEANFSLKMV